MVGGSGACIQTSGAAAGAPGQLIPGFDNKTLAIVAGGLIFILLIAGGKRR
jgi:hypothetical protein